MPSGVGATTIANDPSAQGLPFAPDPGAFFAQTERNEWTAQTFAAPGSGLTARQQLPQVGVMAKLTILFVGTVDVTLGTAGTAVTAGHYPYGLIDQFVLSANAQNDLISVSGADLYAMRAVRHPGYVPNDTVDVFPGGVGPGNNIAADGDIVLTWEVPIAIDDTTLVGALYAQSPALHLEARLRQAVTTDLIVDTNTGAATTITGTFFYMVTGFDIPLAGDAQSKRLIVPDLSRLHGIQAHQQTLNAVGENRAPLIRTNGQLDRLLFVCWEANPAASVADEILHLESDANDIDGFRIEYGAAQRPLDYNPAHFLAARNLDDYADALPGGYNAIDLLAQNPPRDVILMTGVTDLTAVVTVNAGVVLTGTAAIRLVQETLMG